MRKKSGFTLIELLVVVAIIAVLVAVLLPALKSARDQAKLIQCQAKVRFIGQSFLMYTEEYQGWLPEAYINWPGRYRMWTSEMRQYIDPSGGQYVCPADPNPVKVLAANMGPGAGIYSYAYNTRLGYMGRTDSDYMWKYWSAKTTYLLDPSRFVLLNCITVYESWWCFDGPDPTRTIRHNWGTNLLEADGHVVGRKATQIKDPFEGGEFIWGWFGDRQERW
jgi:prepilin-type N-terminal cleavage/methylation domain-containing protein